MRPYKNRQVEHNATTSRFCFNLEHHCLFSVTTSFSLNLNIGKKETGKCGDWKEPRCLTQLFSSLAIDLLRAAPWCCGYEVEVDTLQVHCLPAALSLASLLAKSQFCSGLNMTNPRL